MKTFICNSISEIVSLSKQACNLPISIFFQCFLQNIPHESTGQEIVDCFSLSSLWKFFTETSIYGAGVPILLNNGDACLQYYCPSLSALQIYKQKPIGSPRYFKSSSSLVTLKKIAILPLADN